MTSDELGIRSRQTLGQIFMLPALLGVLAAGGLVFALVADGIWDALSSLALAIPIVVLIACIGRGTRRRRF